MTAFSTQTLVLLCPLRESKKSSGTRGSMGEVPPSGPKTDDMSQEQLEANAKAVIASRPSASLLFCFFHPSRFLLFLASSVDGRNPRVRGHQDVCWLIPGFLNGAKCTSQPSTAFPGMGFWKVKLIGWKHQWYHVGVGAPPILVYFSWDWDVH